MTREGAQRHSRQVCKSSQRPHRATHGAVVILIRREGAHSGTGFHSVMPAAAGQPSSLEYLTNDATAGQQDELRRRGSRSRRRSGRGCAPAAQLFRRGLADGGCGRLNCRDGCWPGAGRGSPAYRRVIDDPRDAQHIDHVDDRLRVGYLLCTLA